MGIDCPPWSEYKKDVVVSGGVLTRGKDKFIRGKKEVIRISGWWRGLQCGLDMRMLGNTGRGEDRESVEAKGIAVLSTQMLHRSRDPSCASL